MQSQQQYGLPSLTQEAVNLLQRVSPVTRDGGQTVVSRLAQNAVAQSMPGGMPPQAQGLGGLAAASPQMQPQSPGSIPQAAQASAIAGQQQQAQQQQAMQAAMQMAQQQQPQQPQMMARGGIASLPADNIARMKYAQGGVIGYSGENDDQLVQPTSDKVLLDIEKEKAQKARDLRDAYQQSLGVMSSIAGSGDQAAIQKYATSTQQTLDALKKHVEEGYGNRASQVLNSLLAPSAERPVAQAKVDYSGMDHPHAEAQLPPVPSPAASRAAPQAAPQAVSRPALQAAPGGIPALIQGMKGPDVAAAIQAARTGIGSDAPITEQEARIKQLGEMMDKLPPAQQEYLQSLKDIQARRLEARKQQAGEEGWDRFMAVMGGLGQSGLGGAGRASTQFTAQQRAQTAQQLAEDEAHAQKIGAIVEAQNNQKINALKGQIDLYGKTIDERNKLNTAVAGLAGHIASSQGHITGAQIAALASVYHTQVGAESAAALRQTQIEANQLAKMESVLRAYTHDYARIEGEINREIEKKYGMYTAMFQNPEMMKDPKNIATYNNSLIEKAAMIKSRLDPISENMKRVQSKVEGMDFGTPPPGAVKRKPGT